LATTEANDGPRPWQGRAGGAPRRGPRGGAALWAEPAALVGPAVLTDTAGGLGAIAFRLMIRACRYGFAVLLVQRGLAWAGPLRRWTPALSPALGLLLVGAITQYLAREVKGHGVPQILEALALRGGRIRPRVGLLGILAPAITIGAGGSVGREGPIALIGAAFGSTIGQLLGLGDAYLSLLLACGAAAGIAATFNAPIAGALFGLEVVPGSYAMGALVPGPGVRSADPSYGGIPRTGAPPAPPRACGSPPAPYGRPP
jgi:CIC family chloride channel protein